MITTSQLPTMDLTDNETGCCPRFDPKHWDEQTFTFDKMLFAKATSKSFNYMPLNLGKVMSSTQDHIKFAGADEKEMNLVLSQDKSRWKTNHYVKVTKNVPGLEMTELSGEYMTKVYDGPYKNVPIYMKKFENYITEQGILFKELFIFYTTCPKCAKHYGHNYMVFFAHI